MLEAQELGAYINGSHRIIGGSPERLLNLVQALFTYSVRFACPRNLPRSLQVDG